MKKGVPTKPGLCGDFLTIGIKLGEGWVWRTAIWQFDFVTRDEETV